MKRLYLIFLAFGMILGISIGLMLRPFVDGVEGKQISLWLEVFHRVCTAIGGLGTFIALIVVLRQFYLLRSQSELVQKNIVASIEAQLYGRLDSFNRFVFEHSREYDLLDEPFDSIESIDARSKLHRMCELGFTFFEEIFKHHVRLQLLGTEDWEEWEQNLLHFLRKPYVKGYWKKVANRYAGGFHMLINDHLRKMETK